MNNTNINLVNMYAPSGSTTMKKLFYKSLKTKFSTEPNLIMMGDWNHVEDNARDRIYEDPNNIPPNTQIQEYDQFIANHGVLDTYLQEYDDEDNDLHVPMRMTCTTARSSSRIDRAYHGLDLEGTVHNLIDRSTTSPLEQVITYQ